MNSMRRKLISMLASNISRKKYNARHTAYTIDQSISYEGDVPVYKLPEDMIINHIPSKDNNNKIVINSKLVYSDAIRRIRENTHLYVGRYNNNINTLEVKQINDTNKTIFVDGTQIVLEDEDDIFMKLPKFWWKAEYNENQTCIITFATEEEDIDSSYKCWEGNVFIGVYKGVIINRGTNETPINKLYSKPGFTPTVNQSWTTFTNVARARISSINTSNIYKLVTYEAHQIMALLGYGWLGTTDSQSIIGKGTSSYPKTTGLCDNKGMTDSSVSVDGNSTSINFWGLENWWGDISEWVDNLKTAGSYNVNILNDDLTTVKRLVTTNLQGNDGEIKQMILGSNCDLIPSLIVQNSNYNRAYTDYGSVHASAGYIASRSSAAAHLYGGLGCLSLSSSSSTAYAYIGSRLLYEGSYELVDNFTEE